APIRQDRFGSRSILQFRQFAIEMTRNPLSLRILFVLPYTPNLVRVRPYNFIRALAVRGHQVSLFAIDDRSGSDRDLEFMREVCERVEPVSLSKIRIAWNLLRALPTRLPLQAAFAWQPGAFSSRGTGSLFSRLDREFDLIHVEHLRAARYGLALKAMLRDQEQPIPVVFDSVDCLSALFRLASNHAARPLNRWIARFELGRNERYESWLVTQFDRVLVTSAADREALQSLSHRGSSPVEISVVPNGVDLTYFKPEGHESDDVATLIMTGKMSYHANIAMCMHFVEDILPLIWRSRPEVRLLIVGKDPPASMQALSQDERIEVAGSVPDLRAYFQKASIAVVPLVYGMGIQNKVLEAMACGIPVVATSPAIAALQVRDGSELFVADRPVDFARHVIDLVDQGPLREKIGAAGRRYVEQHHDWNRIAHLLEEIYTDVVNNQHRR
ncbi:MAG: glycosyltransferase, partial [Anaerolineales bacterium]|nr:glycosyltransferase [Anaerolineales bacterium]